MTNLDSKTLWAIYNDPTVLLSIKNQKILDKIDSFLPYSTGTEIECTQPPGHNASIFTSIPNIMEVASTQNEQRYRIPSGLKGMICMFNICTALKTNMELNPESGIHHHVDFTDIYDSISQRDTFLNENLDWIENELDEWEYKGDYNKRGINWVRWNYLKTLEFRCANMTFDYNVMIKRIIHANSISRRLKELYKLREPLKKLEKLNQEMEKVHQIQSSSELKSVPQEEQKRQIKTRINKIL